MVFRRVKASLPRQLYKANESELTIALFNGAVLWFKGSQDPDSLYGEDVYGAVIDEATRCFIAGTMVDTPKGARPIESLRKGDVVLNAIGAGRVQEINQTRHKHIAVVTVQGYTMVSSVDHKYFTQRGWVEAQYLGRNDTIIKRDSVLQLLWSRISSTSRQDAKVLHQIVSSSSNSSQGKRLRLVQGSLQAKSKYVNTAFLWSELLSEMEDATARDSSTGAISRNQSQDGRGFEEMVGLGLSRGRACTRSTSGSGDYVQARNQSQSISIFESPWSSPPHSWREWCRINSSTSTIVRRVRGHFPSGVLCQNRGREEEGRIATTLLNRPCRLGSQDCYRNRRFQSPWKAPVGRCTQGQVLAGARVDSVEILQSGSSGFSHYSGGEGEVTLYDIGVSGHPSFSVGGFLVHNCKEEAWFAVRSTLTATQGPVRIIGNVKGRRNWAYRLARRAESGEPNMGYHKITAQDAIDAGVLAEMEVQDAKSVLPSTVFQELYLAEASDDQGNPFGITSIAECAIAGLSEEEPVIWGIDLAKSVDWTVCIGLDYRGHICRFERFQRSWEETFGIITRLVGRTPAKCDATGVGDPVVERLQRASDGYIEAFKFSPSSKQQIMEGLAVAIQSHDIGIPKDSIIQAELEEFEYEYTRAGVRYCSPAGVHDDCVDALALAVSGLQLGRTGIGIWV